ncbi:hypothetical protein [Paenibacillus gansuensis]|uniref:Uncharacterized protein n=1 Tax=Paenibacillus gansuensis TaxID=306542 RepID=A0ABW5PHN5_9BACL
MPDVKTAQSIAESQYVFAILFILLLFVVFAVTKKLLTSLQEENKEREKQLQAIYAEQKLESKEREQKLMDHLDRTGETLEKIQQGMVALEHNMQQNFKEVWSELNRRN